jgi:hypothetical protein
MGEAYGQRRLLKWFTPETSYSRSLYRWSDFQLQPDGSATVRVDFTCGAMCGYEVELKVSRAGDAWRVEDDIQWHKVKQARRR